MRNRWYEPWAGRFLSEDPIGIVGGINPYLLAENDPVNRNDPLGLQSHCYRYPYPFPCRIKGLTVYGRRDPTLGVVGMRAGGNRDRDQSVSRETAFYDPESDVEQGQPADSPGPAGEVPTYVGVSLDACFLGGVVVAIGRYKAGSSSGTYFRVGGCLGVDLSAGVEVGAMPAKLFFGRGGDFQVGVGRYAVSWAIDCATYRMCGLPPGWPHNQSPTGFAAGVGLPVSMHWVESYTFRF